MVPSYRQAEMAPPTEIDPAWCITQNGVDAATQKAWEGLFTLGWRSLHVRGSLEEPLASAPQDLRYARTPANVSAERFRETTGKWGCYVPGVYGDHPLLNAELINLPWPLWLVPIVDGERLDGLASQTLEQMRTLDLRRAVLRRTLTWRPRGGGSVRLAYERFVAAGAEGLVAQRLTVTSDRDRAIEIESGVSAAVTTNGYDHFGAVAPRAGVPGVCSVEVETDRGQRIEVSSATRFKAGDMRPHAEARWACWRGRVGVVAGEPVTCEKISRVVVRRRDARASGHAAGEERSASFDALLAQHERAWTELWNACDVEIEGDIASQVAARAAIFHLLRSHPGPGSGLAVDPKAFAGEAYWGRFFWDSEMFLLPFYALTVPPLARSFVDFRVRTLAAAKRNAAARGLPGARYPWEAGPDGEECCPNWQYADHAVHVSADVAWGVRYFSAATGDATVPQNARDVVIETARMWMGRVDRVRTREGVVTGLYGVMGPDEYTPIVANSAYTNRLARFNLELAAELLGAAGAEEAARMREVARSLPIPHDGVLVLQCDGFDRLPSPDFAGLWIDRSEPFARHVPQEYLYRTACLKQADVLMLMDLFADEFTDEQVRAAWERYEPLTTHDSSLSPSVHALVALRLGMHERAWEFWQRLCRIDLDAGKGGAAEGIHIAAAGGLWQVLVFGFGGVFSPMRGSALRLAPRLPRGWSALRFELGWRGQRVAVETTGDGTAVENRSPRPLDVSIRDVVRTVGAGERAEWPSAVGA